MKYVVEQAVRVAFPADVAAELVRMVSDAPNPDPASLSRWRVQVDVAFMKWEQQRYSFLLGDGPHERGLYALCDSSPQGGRDWMMTEVHMLSTGSSDGLLGVFAACADCIEAFSLFGTAVRSG